MAPLTKQQPASPDGPMMDLLKAVPRIADEVESRDAGDGCLHLRRTTPPSGALGTFLQEHLGWTRRHHVNLDQQGSDFWKMIDGRRTLDAIAVSLAMRWHRDLADCREAVLLYTRSLLGRRLIELAPGESSGERRKLP